jgi:hypothetical protein
VVIAERLKRDPRIVIRALERTQRWLRDGSVAEHYARGWQQVLAQAPDRVAEFLVEDSETARAFRQVSPFAGVLSAKERWQLWASEGAGDDATAG